MYINEKLEELHQQSASHLQPMHTSDKSRLVRLIAESLSRIPAYVNGAKGFYSVAQHSILVSEILQANTADYKLALYGLLYRSHDAYIGTVSDTIKATVNHAIGCDAIRSIKDAADAMIFDTLQLPWPLAPELYDQISTARQKAQITELRDILQRPFVLSSNMPPYNRVIKPMPWPKAEECWLEMYDELTSLI